MQNEISDKVVKDLDFLSTQTFLQSQTLLKLSDISLHSSLTLGFSQARFSFQSESNL